MSVIKDIRQPSPARKCGHRRDYWYYLEITSARFHVRVVAGEIADFGFAEGANEIIAVRKEGKKKNAGGPAQGSRLKGHDVVRCNDAARLYGLYADRRHMRQVRGREIRLVKSRAPAREFIKQTPRLCVVAFYPGELVKLFEGSFWRFLARARVRGRCFLASSSCRRVRSVRFRPCRPAPAFHELFIFLFLRGHVKCIEGLSSRLAPAANRIQRRLSPYGTGG